MTSLPGIGGTLFPSRFLTEVLAAEAHARLSQPELARKLRRFTAWWTRAASSCGPASGLRALFDEIAMPLFALLGYRARDANATEVQIRHGLYCGLQNSVIRHRVFERRRFWPDYLVVEDEMFVIRLLADGGRFAYYDDPHVVYRVHGGNSSGSAVGSDPQRNVRIFSEMVRGLERVAREAALSRGARRELRRRRPWQASRRLPGSKTSRASLHLSSRAPGVVFDGLG